LEAHALDVLGWTLSLSEQGKGLDLLYILGLGSTENKKYNTIIACHCPCALTSQLSAFMSSESQKAILTIQNVVNPRSRPSKQDTYVSKKRTPEEIAQSAKKRADMQKDVDDVLDLLNAKAEELAEKYEKKSSYFTNWLFHGGAKMVSSRASSSWNAWKSIKMKELKEEGVLQNTYQLKAC